MKVSVEDLICCGFVSTGTDCKVFFNPAEGSLVYKDENDGDWYYVSEVAAKEVHEVKDYYALLSAYNKGTYGTDAIGVITLSDMVVVILDETTAETRPYYPVNKPTGQTFRISLSEVCESIDDEYDL